MTLCNFGIGRAKCLREALPGVEHCRNHLTHKDWGQLPVRKESKLPTHIQPFSPQSSLSHIMGEIKKQAAVGMLEMAYAPFIALMQNVAASIILEKGEACTDDLHIWCEVNGHKVPRNDKNMKTAMSAVFKDKKRFVPIMCPHCHQPLRRKSRLESNNARVICVYALREDK